MNLRLLVSGIVLFFLAMADSPGQMEYREQWPGFRGPFATGILDNAGTPVQWDAASGKNIRWKTRIHISALIP